MMEIIIGLFLGGVIGLGAGWIIWRNLPQQKIREINYQRLQEEQRLFEEQKIQHEQEIEDLLALKKERQEAYDLIVNLNTEKVYELQSTISNLQIESAKEQGEIKKLQAQKQTAQEAFLEMEKQNEAYLQSRLALGYEHLSQALQEIGEKYRTDEEAYRLEYEQVINDYATQFREAIAQYDMQILEATNTLKILQSNIDTMIENAKREEQKRQEKNFYRLDLPESDIEEIRKLRSVEPYLRDKEALNKVIWKVYYEKPYTDMIGRVLGAKIITGIYKITNMKNNMCYIGQAANVSERWRQHIKRGIGAEPPTRNKLYPAMLTFGVENFTFELLEECSRDKLDEREDHWQEVYHAKDFGYSIK